MSPEALRAQPRRMTPAYGIDPLPDFGRSYQRCTAADARSEIADAEIARRRLHDEPPRHFREPASQQADVETQTPHDIVPDLLLRAQQIEKQRAIARFADDSRDELIARTVPAAGAAVCEYHDAVCSASRLTRRFREERLDDFFQVGALAFRAVHLLGLVFLDGQHFTKFVMALAADVFVKGHRLVRLLVEGSVSFDKPIFLTAVPRFPLLVKGLPLFALRKARKRSKRLRNPDNEPF